MFYIAFRYKILIFYEKLFYIQLINKKKKKISLIGFQPFPSYLKRFALNFNLNSFMTEFAIIWKPAH